MKDLKKTLNTIVFIKEVFGDNEFSDAQYREKVQEHHAMNKVYYSLQNCKHIIEYCYGVHADRTLLVNYVNGVRVTPKELRLLETLGLKFTKEEELISYPMMCAEEYYYKLKIDNYFKKELRDTIDLSKEILMF